MFALIVSIGNAQEKKQNKFLKSIFKYSTFYGSYGETNSIQGKPTFIVTQNNDLIETTRKTPADNYFTIGWRKLANFQYEDRDKFYDGDENNVGTRSNIGNAKGLEYLFQHSKGRQQGDSFVNHNYFLRYLSKWWLAKAEWNKNELVDLDYKSAEFRLRLPIGNKLSLSGGAIYRTYEKAYGYNPIEDYLDNNYWWTLAYNFANHTDQLYQMINPFTQEVMGYDYQWFNEEGNLIAASDADYRNGVFQNVVNRYNESELNKIGSFADLSYVVGLDFYHYRKNFWAHFYGNILTGHKLIEGDEAYSYNNFVEGSWIDWSAGGVFGFRISKSIGVFTEINLQRYWDRKIQTIKTGLNFKI